MEARKIKRKEARSRSQMKASGKLWLSSFCQAFVQGGAAICVESRWLVVSLMASGQVRTNKQTKERISAKNGSFFFRDKSWPKTSLRGYRSKIY